MPVRSALPPGHPSLTAGGSAQQNQGSSRCGTPPDASAGCAQSCRDPRPARCQTATRISARDRPSHSPAVTASSTAGLEGVDLGVGMPPREDESAGVKRAEHGGHLW